MLNCMAEMFQEIWQWIISLLNGGNVSDCRSNKAHEYKGKHGKQSRVRALFDTVIANLLYAGISVPSAEIQSVHDVLTSIKNRTHAIHQALDNTRYNVVVNRKKLEEYVAGSSKSWIEWLQAV